MTFFFNIFCWIEIWSTLERLLVPGLTGKYVHHFLWPFSVGETTIHLLNGLVIIRWHFDGLCNVFCYLDQVGATHGESLYDCTALFLPAAISNSHSILPHPILLVVYISSYEYPPGESPPILDATATFRCHFRGYSGRVSTEDEKRVRFRWTLLQHEHIFKNFNCLTREWAKWVSERAKQV